MEDVVDSKVVVTDIVAVDVSVVVRVVAGVVTVGDVVCVVDSKVVVVFDGDDVVSFASTVVDGGARVVAVGASALVTVSAYSPASLLQPSTRITYVPGLRMMSMVEARLYDEHEESSSLAVTWLLFRYRRRKVS